MFAFGFFGAVLSLLLALAAYAPRPHSRRFLLVALTAVLYIGGGFIVTFLVNVPMRARNASDEKTVRTPFHKFHGSSYSALT